MNGCSFGQHMADQGPRYENAKRRGRRESQVVGKTKIIRPDKRKKARYL